MRVSVRSSASLARHGEGAELGDLGHAVRDPLQPRPLARLREAVGQLHLGVAAQQHGAFPLQPRADRSADRAHGGDGRDTKRETGEEHPEACESAPKLAPREAPGDP